MDGFDPSKYTLLPQVDVSRDITSQPPIQGAVDSGHITPEEADHIQALRQIKPSKQGSVMAVTKAILADPSSGVKLQKPQEYSKAKLSDILVQ